MNFAFVTDAVKSFFADRVFGHLPSTIAGGLAAVAASLAVYLGTLPVDPKYQLYVFIASAVLAGIGAAYKPPVKPTDVPKTLILLLALSFASVASAQDTAPKFDSATFAPEPTPRFGGCLNGGATCFSPNVSVTLMAVNLKTGVVTTSVSPGLGYGVTFNSQKWYKIGLAAYATFRDTAEGQKIVPSVVGSFAEYVRIGVGYQVGGQDKPFLLIGLGTDFGTSP